MPWSIASRGVDHYRFTVYFNHAADGFTHAKNKLSQFRTPGTD